MKKFYKFLGLFSIMLFSFFYTEKIAILMQNKSPIMQNIEKVKDNYLVSAVNASIEGDYIVPGIMGRMVNKNKSFVNMKAFGIFNEYYLIFDDIKPDISLEENKDKIIKEGNKEKKGVAFLLEDGNDNIKKYLKDNKIKASLLITEASYDKINFFEQVNNDQRNYKNVESLLNKNNQNKNICYVKKFGKDFCIKEKKYMIEEKISLGESNFVDVKQNITNGAIIFIKKNSNLDNLKLLLKEIQFKGLNIYYVSELIAEKK